MGFPMKYLFILITRLRIGYPLHSSIGSPLDGKSLSGALQNIRTL
jgi:hypothetical protein